MTNCEIIKELKVFLKDSDCRYWIGLNGIKAINSAIQSLQENEVLRSKEQIHKVETEQLKIESKQSAKCINDTWLFIEEIVEKAKKRDLSLFRSSSIGGCDMYQGCPPVCRIHDALFHEHEEVIQEALYTQRNT